MYGICKTALHSDFPVSSSCKIVPPSALLDFPCYKDFSLLALALSIKKTAWKERSVKTCAYRLDCLSAIYTMKYCARGWVVLVVLLRFLLIVSRLIARSSREQVESFRYWCPARFQQTWWSLLNSFIHVGQPPDVCNFLFQTSMQVVITALIFNRLFIATWSENGKWFPIPNIDSQYACTSFWAVPYYHQYFFMNFERILHFR